MYKYLELLSPMEFISIHILPSWGRGVHLSLHLSQGYVGVKIHDLYLIMFISTLMSSTINTFGFHLRRSVGI
jgi:hypothetical protein